MSRTPVSRRWIFLSDAHLDLTPGRRDGGAALAAFLESIAPPSDLEVHVVLLGDVFELLDPCRRDEPASRRRLHAVLDANGPVVDALARCLRAGIVVDVVPGNHDIDLVRPAVAGDLRRRLGDDDERLVVHPWLYVVPGVLYAEHGNQHHDLNRFPSAVAPYATGRPDEMHVPPLALARAPGAGPWRHRASMATVAARSWTAERMRPPAAAAPALREIAANAGLDPDLVVALHALSRLRPGRSAVRLGAVGLRHLAGRVGHEDRYLLAAAERVRRTFAAGGVTFPCYVFGHTHAARDRVLGDGSSRYLNCGTWSDHVRRGDTARAAHHFSYVEVDAGPDGVRAALRWWHHPGAGRLDDRSATTSGRALCAID